MILLEKLLEISEKKNFLNKRKYSKQSLNFDQRKKQAEKIDYENSKIAKRIAKRPPEIPLKKIIEDYNTANQLKKRISRYNILANRKSSSAKKNPQSINLSDFQEKSSAMPISLPQKVLNN